MPDPLMVLRILWGALTLSTLLIAGLAVLLPVPGQPSPPQLVPPVLGGVSLTAAVVGFLLPRHTFALAMKRHEPLVTTEPDPDVEVVYRAKAPVTRVLHVDAAAFRSICAAWQTP